LKALPSDAKNAAIVMAPDKTAASVVWPIISKSSAEWMDVKRGQCSSRPGVNRVKLPTVAGPKTITIPSHVWVLCGRRRQHRSDRRSSSRSVGGRSRRRSGARSAIISGGGARLGIPRTRGRAPGPRGSATRAASALGHAGHGRDHRADEGYRHKGRFNGHGRLPEPKLQPIRQALVPPERYTLRLIESRFHCFFGCGRCDL
jgi:hypothetical protein